MVKTFVTDRQIRKESLSHRVEQLERTNQSTRWPIILNIVVFVVDQSRRSKLSTNPLYKVIISFILRIILEKVYSYGNRAHSQIMSNLPLKLPYHPVQKCPRP